MENLKKVCELYIYAHERDDRALKKFLRKEMRKILDVSGVVIIKRPSLKEIIFGSDK